MTEPVRLNFGGDLDAASSSIWRERLAATAGHDLTIDLSDVTFVDSAFVNELVMLAREGRRITVFGLGEA